MNGANEPKEQEKQKEEEEEEDRIKESISTSVHKHTLTRTACMHINNERHEDSIIQLTVHALLLTRLARSLARVCVCVFWDPLRLQKELRKF